MQQYAPLLAGVFNTTIKSDVLLCIHAHLLNRHHVPRVFLPHVIGNHEAAMLLDELLLSHPVRVAQKTQSQSRPYIYNHQIDINSKHVILNDIESALIEQLGDGRIVYEESRFSPYGDSLFATASELITIGSPRISQDALFRREKAKQGVPHQNTAGMPCTPLKRSLRAFYEQKWASSWMEPSVYLKPGDPHRTIQTVLIRGFEA